MQRKFWICIAAAAILGGFALSSAEAKARPDPKVVCSPVHRSPKNRAWLMDCTFAGAGAFKINAAASISGNQPGEHAGLSIMRDNALCSPAPVMAPITGETTVRATCDVNVSAGTHPFNLDLDYSGDHPVNMTVVVVRKK